MTPVTDRGMLPLQHLLNPSVSPPETPSGSQKTSHIGASHSNIDTIHSTTTTPKHADSDASKRPEDSTILAKCRPRGPINFPPFEDVDDTALQQLSKFKVTPLGKIHQEFHHIPYSSSKKDLFDKTGRESIEAFRYEFQVPGRDTTFIVMWDYSIGIVRMNPFIKWGQFPKTKSSQLLDKNPGLREISPGITGGSVLAQGYWIPYKCARALFATFCHPIAGALIPLFGPTFPLDCIPPESNDYGNAAISSCLIQEASHEAELSKYYYMEQIKASRNALGHPPLLQSSRGGHDDRSYIYYNNHMPPYLRFKGNWENPASFDNTRIASHPFMRERPCRNHETPTRGTNLSQHPGHRRSEPYPLRGTKAQLSDNQDGQGLFPVAWEYKKRRISQDHHLHHRGVNKPCQSRASDVEVDPRLLESSNNEVSDVQNQVNEPDRGSAQYSAAMALLLLSEDAHQPPSASTA